MAKLKRNHKVIFMILALAMLLLVLPMNALAVENPLDEIQNYTIQVDMRNDGTMDIKYRLEWTVLDDTSEGPLSWVKVGIPNKNVDEITALTSNIDKIKYEKESGQTYVFIYFDREYHANETIIFEFSIHQSNMYVIDKEDHTLRYSFTPGWFDEIEVKNITIMWNNHNVLKSNNNNEPVDGYLVWNASLTFGEKLNASVYYNLDAFEATEEGQVIEDDDGVNPFVILIIIVVVIVFIMLILSLIDDGYGGGSGYGGSRTHIYTSSRCACACASRCACACACAGGGRAGCAKKDFYHTNVQTDTLMKVLKEDN